VPVVSCPSSQIIASNLSANISVSFTAPTATDNLGIASTLLQVAAAAPLVDGVLNGTNYTFARAGTATFTFYAYDSVENSNLCFWSITVLPPVVIPDTKIPNITGCPTNITTSTPTVLFSSYPPSTYTIVQTTIWDRSFTNITLPTLNASDESGVTAMYLDWSANPQTTFFAGTYVVAYKAVDPSGNTAYCVYRVQVIDPQPPRWTNCPISMTSRTGPGRSTAPALSWPPQGIIAVDNVQVVNQFGSCQSTPPGFCPPSGAISTANYSVGTVVFNYTAVDLSGNSAPACVFSVTVIDDDPPQLHGCPTQPLQTRTSPGVNYTDISPLCPNFTFTDNVGIHNTSLTSSPPGYSCSSQIPIMNGLSLIFRVTDTSGLVTSCLFTVSVLDLEKPTIPQCPLNTLSFSAFTDPGSSLALVNYTNLTAMDNSGSAAITSLSFPLTGLNSGSYFPLGVTSILYNALDPSLNGASCIVVITVADSEPPTIFNCPTQNFVLPNDPGMASAWLVLPDLNATDNVRIQGASFFPYYFEPSGNFTFAIGLTPMEYSAQDTSFNKASCAFSVRVEDREAPRFTGCPQGVQFNLTADQGLPSTVFRFPAITVADNFDPVSIFTISSSPLGFTDGSPFIVGRTRVTLSSTDRAGNPGICEFFVHVADTQPPLITCPDSQLFQTLNPTDIQAPVTWRAPIVTDNYFVVSVVSNLSPGG
jgi:large repetitive protein